MKQVSVTTKVLAENSKGEIALIKRGYGLDVGTWDAPGGRLEFGETFNECSKREFKEETGLEVIVNEFIGLSEIISRDDNKHVVFLYYYGKAIGDELKYDTDAIDAKWVKKANLLDTDNLRPVLKDVLLKSNWVNK